MGNDQMTESQIFLQGVYASELQILLEAQRKQKEKQIKEEQKQQRYREKVKEICFDKYDTNHDGVLELSELKQYIRDLCERTGMQMPSQAFLGMLFKSCDDDKNQRIDFDEFMKHFGR